MSSRSGALIDLRTRKSLYITKKLSIDKSNFTTEIRSIEKRGFHGHALTHEVLSAWEKWVTRVARSVIGEKTVVCRSASWWDEEIKGNKGKRCIRDFGRMETTNYGLSIVSCVKK